MSVKATLIIAATLGLATLTGCVDGGPRYGDGYRTPGPVVVERVDRTDRYDRRDDRRGPHVDRRGPDRRDDRYQRDDRRDGRLAELCRRDPRARECRGYNDGRRY
jgi:hypothetical protein